LSIEKESTEIVLLVSFKQGLLKTQELPLIFKQTITVHLLGLFRFFDEFLMEVYGI